MSVLWHKKPITCNEELSHEYKLLNFIFLVETFSLHERKEVEIVNFAIPETHILKIQNS